MSIQEGGYPNQLLGIDGVNDPNAGAINQLAVPTRIGGSRTANCIVSSGSGAPTIGGNVGDLYVNTAGSDIAYTYFYRCTTAGAAGIAAWSGYTATGGYPTVGVTPDGTTDNSAAFTSAITSNRVVRVPYNSNAYVILNVRIPANTTVIVDPGVKFKLPAAGLSSGDGCFLIGATWGSANPDENIALVGGPYTFDLTGKVAGNTLHGVLIGGARFFTVENARGLNMPDGNPITMSMGGPANSGSAVPENGIIRNIKAVGAPAGYGAIQCTGGKHLLFENIDTDGGFALRLETDGQAADVTDVVAQNLRCIGGVGAFDIACHAQTIRNVHVSGLHSTGTYLASFGSPGSGGMYGITLDTGYHAGGTNTVNYSNDGTAANWLNKDAFVFRNITSSGASALSFMDAGDVWEDCKSLTGTGGGWQAANMSSTIFTPVQLRSTWRNCLTYNSGYTNAWEMGNFALNTWWGCQAIDDRGGGSLMGHGFATWRSASVKGYMFGCYVSGATSARTLAANGSSLTDTNPLS